MPQPGYPPGVVYIGLQKTGSTYLRHYFYNHPEIHCTRHGTFFQTAAADVARHGGDAVRSRYEALFADDPGKPCRIDMYEAIGMGYVLEGLDAWNARDFIKVDAPLNAEHIFTAPVTVAERVRAVVPDAKVLLTIRNQAGWLDSNYRHYFEQLPAGRETLLDFLSTPEGKVVMDVAMFDRVVEIYDRLFGPERVLVLPMERIERDEGAALRDLCQFLGVEHLPYRREDKDFNRGRALGALMSTRKVGAANQSGGLFDRLLGRKQPQWQMTTEEALKHLACVYAASNARLSRRIGVDLSALGYPC
ncbi:sulfotransferase [Sulfurisoma sediminicola]|uniref:Sulfotransferase family protein n=1 Tax=Sulfurisoma sediminicola TaxID=1381557 RepID=A0A497XJ90_9PROT|nr:sulfotransferase [Sulfurisoma sediminicola]RLJ68002.1 sulfotransferase family protein [Sulfurisoma sediminicola]